MTYSSHGAAGELTELARRAADEGAERLVVVGGDGSVHEVVNGIAQREGVEIAVIPRGTGWDFARSLGIPHNPDRAIEVALSGTVRTIDLGRATYRRWDGAEGISWFANVGSAGMSGAIAQRANDTTKALGGKVSYVWATFAVFARWSNSEVDVSVGAEKRHARMHDVVVANGPYFGGGMKICPDASPGRRRVRRAADRRPDEAGSPVHDAEDLPRHTPAAPEGGAAPRSASARRVAAEPLPIQLDGEQPGTTPARFEAVPQALRVRVPG